MSSARFTLRLDPDLKQWLEEEAARRERSAGWIAKQAIEGLRRASEARRQMLAEAVAEADEGQFVSHEAVHRWMDSWDTDAELPVPAADLHLRKT